MINNLQLLKQFDEQISSKELTSIQQKILVSKYTELLLAQLEAGDQIEGIIAKTDDNKFVLQVKPNIAIPIQLFEQMEQLEAGKLMNFLVQGKENGKLFLKPSSIQGEKEISLVQKTLQELGLPKHPVMEEIVDDFLQKHLPLAKEVLLKAYEASKSLDIPSKVVANLADHQLLLPKEVGTLSGLRENGLGHIVTDLKTVIEGLEKPVDRMAVFNTLKEGIPEEKITALFQEIQEDLVKSAVKQPNGKKGLVTEINTADINQTVSKSNLQNVSISEEALLKLFSSIEGKDASSMGSLFKRFIGKVFDEAVAVCLEAMKGDLGESGKIYSTYNVLTKLLKTLDKAELSKEDKEYISYVKEPVSMLGKFNVDAEYFAFPMLQNDKLRQAELYFFKPKKGAKKSKENMYIVVALSLPHIQDIEIHINKQEKNVLLNINVENETVQKYLSQSMPRLNEAIESLGFILSKVSWGLINREGKKDFLSQEEANYSFSHMDFKI